MKSGGIVIVGIGGSGVLKTSEVLSTFLIFQGFDVRQSEVHGMAQRGGSVITQLKFGEKVFSPLLAKGEAQYMIATEEMEALRYIDYLSPKSSIILNMLSMKPVGIPSTHESEKAAPLLRRNGFKVYEIPATSIAIELKNPRVANTVLIGAFSRIFAVNKEKSWRDSIRHIFSKHGVEKNIQAFEEGRKNIPIP